MGGTASVTVASAVAAALWAKKDCEETAVTSRTVRFSVRESRFLARYTRLLCIILICALIMRSHPPRIALWTTKEMCAGMDMGER